ncbi:MAG TPA: TlpA disulfide reductase family protein [Kofleriaceae bacterium]|nr:TlpA disulfide reductase family protein [Kofleriaceae bacterium]
MTETRAVAEGAGDAGAARAAAAGAGDAGAAPGLITRIGLAVVRPRWALAVASDRRVAGRSGTDLIALIAIVLLATQLRALAGAVWLGAAIDGRLAVGAVTRILTRALVLDLSFLVVGALVLWLGAGARRNLGRAFDLACVAAIPLFLVSLAAAVVARAIDAPLPAPALWLATGVAWSWSGALFALAWRPARLPPGATPPPPRAAVVPARRAGWGVVALCVLGAALHVVWIAQNLELIRPVEEDQLAPTFTLAEIGPGGARGPAFTLGRGRVTVLDFWATWCGPCIKAMPKLAALAAQHPDVDVVAVNLDDAVAARALFERHGWMKLRLVADDGEVSQRYNVSSIPHSVVIDRGGVVRHIARGGSSSVEAAVRAALFRK